MGRLRRDGSPNEDPPDGMAAHAEDERPPTLAWEADFAQPRRRAGGRRVVLAYDGCQFWSHGDLQDRFGADARFYAIARSGPAPRSAPSPSRTETLPPPSDDDDAPSSFVREPPPSGAGGPKTRPGVGLYRQVPTEGGEYRVIRGKRHDVA